MADNPTAEILPPVTIGGVPDVMAPTKSIFIKYSPEVVDSIVQQFIAGVPLYKIAGQDGMPSYTTLLRWVQSREEFREALQAARIARALHFEDAALRSAGEPDSPLDKDDVPGQRLKFDAMKWAAEVNNPVVYGRKTIVEGNVDKPLVLVVKTGVPDPTGMQKPPELNIDGTVVLPPERKDEARNREVEDGVVTQDPVPPGGVQDPVRPGGEDC